jgi:hypothetical protein
MIPVSCATHTTPFTSVLLPCNQPEINTASTMDDETWSEAKSAFLRLLRGCSFERFYNQGGEKKDCLTTQNGSLFFQFLACSFGRSCIYYDSLRLILLTLCLSFGCSFLPIGSHE